MSGLFVGSLAGQVAMGDVGNTVMVRMPGILAVAVIVVVGR